MKDTGKHENDKTVMSKSRPGDLQEQRRKYDPPRILCTEVLEARAVVCLKSTDYACGGGPIIT